MDGAAAGGVGAEPVRPPATELARLVPADVDLERPARHPQAPAVWLGHVWSRLGRGDLAWAWWDRAAAPQLEGWVAAERGRVLRELGDHAGAEHLEAAALPRAMDPVDTAMLHVSLVADAVGRADRAQAQRRLAAAREAVTAVPDGPRAARQRLRLSWVEVEVAWLTGRRPDPTDLPAWDQAAGAPALSADYRAGTTFHIAKGLLFGGVVRADRRLLDAARELAPPMLVWAVELARADHGVPGASAAAHRLRRRVVAPPGVRTPTGSRG